MRIEIDETIGNFHIRTFHRCSFKNNKHKEWTELYCWHELDCENCPLSWEDRGYEDVDCGCYAAEPGEEYPRLAICMLPNWIKKILLRHRLKEYIDKEIKALEQLFEDGDRK